MNLELNTYVSSTGTTKFSGNSRKINNNMPSQCGLFVVVFKQGTNAQMLAQ